MKKEYFAKNKDRACFRKMRFDTEKKARDFAARSTVWSGVRQKAYYCIHCRGWHNTATGFTHHPGRPDYCHYRNKKTCEISRRNCNSTVQASQCIALKKSA